MWDLIVSVPDHCLPFYFTGANAVLSCQKRFRLLYLDCNVKSMWHSDGFQIVIIIVLFYNTFCRDK